VATAQGEYELVEDVHLAACHALVKSLAADAGAGAQAGS
jgi:hypothetical protein